MKITLLGALALGFAAVAATASAQDSEALTVRTTVSPFCSTMSAAAPAPLALASLVNGQGQLVAAFNGTTSRDLGAYYCNGPASVTLTATPLTQTAGDPVTDTTGFTNRVDYQAQLVWDDVTLPVNSEAGAPASLVTTEANTGNLIVSVSSPAVEGARRPIAGDYAASVTLTVALQP